MPSALETASMRGYPPRPSRVGVSASWMSPDRSASPPVAKYRARGDERIAW
jgi:hypothetical protein